MRWTSSGRGDIEDQRGRSGGVGVAQLGIGGFLILLVLSWVSGTNLFTLLGTGDTTPTQTVGTSGELRTSPSEERMVDFVNAVTKDAQDTWSEILGPRYQRTRVVLFRDAIDSACGFAQSATGPFYCPSDGKVYLDLSFFNELSQRFGAPGDAAAAYVIAHEVGHHVQDLQGTLNQAHDLQDRASKTEGNAVQVRVELQADCYAGVWAASAHDSQGSILEPGDAQEALRAAEAVGDDTLQKQAQGYVVPDSFTHGTSAERMAAFQRGLKGASLAACKF